MDITHTNETTIEWIQIHELEDILNANTSNTMTILKSGVMCGPMCVVPCDQYLGADGRGQQGIWNTITS